MTAVVSQKKYIIYTNDDSAWAGLTKNVRQCVNYGEVNSDLHCTSGFPRQCSTIFSNLCNNPQK